MFRELDNAKTHFTTKFVFFSASHYLVHYYRVGQKKLDHF